MWVKIEDKGPVVGPGPVVTKIRVCMVWVYYFYINLLRPGVSILTPIT